VARFLLLSACRNGSPSRPPCRMRDRSA